MARPIKPASPRPLRSDGGFETADPPLKRSSGHGNSSGQIDGRAPAAADDEDEEYPEFLAQADLKYEEVKKGDIHIAALQRLTMKELLDLAQRENISEYAGLKKQDLIFRILK